MGILFSSIDDENDDENNNNNNESIITTESVINAILNSEKFQDYQNKFENLVPSRELYINEGDLVLELVMDGLYSIHQYEYDWLKPSSIDSMYGQLDKIYKLYGQQNNSDFDKE